MFGERLKIIRIEHNLKQKDIATILNISPSTIGMYEQGRRTPDTESLKFLANHFDVTIDWLLGISNIRNPYKNLKNVYKNTRFGVDLTGLTKEDMEKVVEYIELLKLRSM